jgi:uncharacterized protein (TIGR01777 family)
MTPNVALTVAVSGASGLIGRALVAALRQDGHTVLRLVRRQAAAPDEISWGPGEGRLDPAALAGVDAVVHLSGAGVGDRRWTEQYKRELYDSRVVSTRTVVSALLAAGEATPRPRVLLSASGVGCYGDTGDRVVDEQSPFGTTFLARLCRDWEAAAEPAAQAGVRVVNLRTGLVLSPGGGMLARMLPVFRLGLGGRLGSGRQYWPWITLADEVGAIRFLLTAQVPGPVNLTAPQPVRNSEFTTQLARAVHRPGLAWVPRPALRVVLGKFAEEVLGGQRAVPAVLQRSGYRFQHPDLDTALSWALSQ